MIPSEHPRTPATESPKKDLRPPALLLQMLHPSPTWSPNLTTDLTSIPSSDSFFQFQTLIEIVVAIVVVTSVVY